jgi:UDP-N-acetylglucosamine enolpyruvyl transferase
MTMTRYLQSSGRVGGVTVQTACGEMHVIALWRLLTAAGANVRGASTGCVRHGEFERITISFEPLGQEQADLILAKLDAQAWVTHALLHVLAAEIDDRPG